jgi:glycerol-3-phosphate dehydrogenase (NAD(P)+)
VPKVAILGAGSLGTALALALPRRDRTLILWSIEPEVVQGLKRSRENQKYLPGFVLSPAVHCTLDLAEALDDADAALLTVPSYAVREVARQVVKLVPDRAVLVCAAKGLEEGTWLRMTQVIRQELPPDLPVPVVAMSGPCLAAEIARGSASAVDAACESIQAARKARHLIATPRFLMKPTADVAGVEAGGTFKNAYAVGAGIGEGLGWGMNERASFLTRALGEMARLASVLGARRATIYGLSGLGDLAVTSFSPHSRNRKIGEELARGRPLREILAGLVSVAEGIAAARSAHTIAQQYHLRLPIAAALDAILHDGAEPKSLEKALTGGR